MDGKLYLPNAVGELGLYGTVSILHDVVRTEEKLIMKALNELNVRVDMINVDEVPLDLGRPKLDLGLCVVRVLSHVKASLVARVLNIHGIDTVNSGESIELSWNKALTIAKLSSFGLPVTPTKLLLNSNPGNVDYPVIVKPIYGSWGRLIGLVRSNDELEILLRHRSMLNNQLRMTMIQPFVGDGTDIRIFVIGNEAVAGMRRRPPGDDWRSNLARGGHAEPIRVSDEVGELAVKATEALGLDYAGVDLLHGDGYLINEVNAIPEFRGLMSVTNVDIPKLLASYLKSRIKR